MLNRRGIQDFVSMPTLCVFSVVKIKKNTENTESTERGLGTDCLMKNGENDGTISFLSFLVKIVLILLH
jgi:hypothetical protein